MWLKLQCAGRIALCHQPLTHYYFDGDDRISRNPVSVERGHRTLYNRILSDYAPAEKAKDIRAFQRFHLAQTLVYFTGIRRGAIAPALRNMLMPHGRTTRRSSAHLIGTALGLIRS